MNHEINISNRTKITISEVTSVDGFDEKSICANLKGEDLMIYGTGLHIEGLDLEEGILTASGNIESIAYIEKKEKKAWWKRVSK